MMATLSSNGGGRRRDHTAAAAASSPICCRQTVTLRSNARCASLPRPEVIPRAPLPLSGTWRPLYGESELYKTSATDPVTFALAAMVLAGVGLVATLRPARWAMAIDPPRKLQSE